MEYKELKYEVSEGILTLTLNNPDKMNSITASTCRELLDAFDRADNDDDVRVVIVTGAGRAFSAGAALGGGEEAKGSYFMERFMGREDDQPHRDEGGIVVLRIYDMKKPIIAAINGSAVGFGITMTFPMDVRIASTNAKMGLVFCRRGIVFDGCASWFLTRLVNMGVATEWVYSGRVFSAKEAFEKGLVSELLEPEALLPRAREIAASIANNSSPISVALCRQLMWKMLGADHPMEAHQVESKALNWIFGVPDAKEGIMSFLEKRPPAFPMKTSKDMPAFYPWWKDRQFKY